MKKITLLMALFCAITVFSQKRITAQVTALINNNTQFRPVAPLAANNTLHPATDKLVKDATYATLNLAQSADIAQNKYPYLELAVPYNGSTITLQLYRAEVMAQGFHVDTDKQKNNAYSAGAYYRGIIKGNYNSVAAISFFNTGMTGIISGGKLQNLVIGKLKSSREDYIIYSDANLEINSAFKCAATDKGTVPGFSPKKKQERNVQTTRCVTLYFEIDYMLYEGNNYSVTETTDWITALFNNVQTLYNNDGIDTAIKSVFVWTEPDPYDGVGSSDYLYQFYANRPSFDGDAGMLVGDDEGGLGGVAISIAGLCSTENVSYSDVDLYFEDLPVFSWDVEVVTHELGHLFGSPHTHGCYWNGNDTAIDGCGTSAGYTEGDCEQGPLPDPETGGTIMSYCHLVDGVGINFANGFGPQPAQRIREHISFSLCLSADCINTCFNDVADLNVIDVSTNSLTVKIKYNEAEQSPGPWQIAYAPYGQTPSNWQEPTSNPVISVNGLNPNTYYSVAVRRACSDVQVTPSQQVVAMTAGDWCNQTVVWKDPDGNNNYADGQKAVRLIKAEPGSQITVNFSTFVTEIGFDFMYVYEGAGTDGNLLGTYDGSTPAESFVINGGEALSFVFVSDAFVNFDGWQANINCTLNTTSHNFKNMSFYPNPVNNKLTINTTEGIEHIAIYNVAGQLLTDKQVTATNSLVTDMSGYAAGVYFIKINNSRSSATLKIIKQ